MSIVEPVGQDKGVSIRFAAGISNGLPLPGA